MWHQSSGLFIISIPFSLITVDTDFHTVNISGKGSLYYSLCNKSHILLYYMREAETNGGFLRKGNDKALWELMQSDYPIHTLLVKLCSLIGLMMKLVLWRYNNCNHRGLLISWLNNYRMLDNCSVMMCQTVQCLFSWEEIMLNEW